MTPSFDIIRSLEIFISVAETGSMTVASRRLGITQSAISQQIKLLEADIGATLFDRQSRPLKLTMAGTTLHQRAGRLVLDTRETWVSVAQASGTLLPNLRVAVLSTFARPLVPRMLAAVRDGTLGVQTISIMRGTSHNHTQDLINREIDVAVTSDALYQHDSIERHELVRERFILLLPRGAAVHGGLRALGAKFPFIRYTSRTQSGQLIEQHLRRLRLEIVPKFALESPEDLIASVAAGHGWSVITPSQLAYSLLQTDAVDLQPLPKPGLTRSISMITRKGEFPVVADQLSSQCRRAMRELIFPKVSAILPHIPDAFLLSDGEAFAVLD